MSKETLREINVPGGRLRVLDLFSGIGGFSLGLERAGMQTVAFCEIDPFCRQVLAKHWPGVPCYDDVRTLSADRLAADGIAVDVICGGFPCQDISTAGHGDGLSGERSGLWREYSRLVGEIRPQFVVVENVAALLFRGLGDVLGDLAALGYDAEWHCIPASHAGAAHRRDRVWVVAYPNGQRCEAVLRIETCQFGEESGEAWRALELRGTRFGRTRRLPASGVCRVVDGVPVGVDRLRALGNAVVPQIPEMIGRAILEAA